MKVALNEEEVGRLKDIASRYGWQVYTGNTTVDMCKKFPDLNDVAWMTIDLERLKKGERLDKLLYETIAEFKAVCGACRVALSRETSIKDMNERDAVIRLYQYINQMVDIKKEMTDILKEIRDSGIKLIK